MVFTVEDAWGDSYNFLIWESTLNIMFTRYTPEVLKNYKGKGFLSELYYWCHPFRYFLLSLLLRT